MTLSANPQTDAQLLALTEKYSLEGKDLSSYLEKLLQEKNVDYCDYLNLDTLLTLQKPRSAQPDEMIFIAYHQIVELYFRLIIWELGQLTAPSVTSAEVFYEKIMRINRYIQLLVNSFQVILQGLDKEQFQKFRYTLFPASGSQSYQFRLIEIYLCDLKNLVSVRYRDDLPGDADLAATYERLYWKKGMTNPRTGKKNPTLLDFETRYNELLYQHAAAHQHSNLWQTFIRHYADSALASGIAEAMRQLDELFNVYWGGLHYSVVIKHLTNDDHTSLPSTGNTHWQKYLHPSYRKVIFFPKLWSAQEIEEWGIREPWNQAAPMPVQQVMAMPSEI